jgi:peptide/nickel transport system ATP-binding protein
VRHPQHPYTQLLIGSIPRANPHRRRDASALVDLSEEQAQGESYCKFVDRCPHAMPQCGDAAPPMFRSEPRRLVACYLFEEHPSVSLEELATALTGPTA